MSGYGITSFFFFFNDTATTEIYTLSLHDALPISFSHSIDDGQSSQTFTSSNNVLNPFDLALEKRDRKSTRLNSSHSQISYAVFCLKKKHSTFHIRPWPSTASATTVPNISTSIRFA